MWIVILVIFILAAIVRLAFWITRNERNRDKPETTITTSTVLGISVRRETTTGGDQPDIKIILTAWILLPPPLSIGNDDVPAQDELRFDTDDFPAINLLIDREALARLYPLSTEKSRPRRVRQTAGTAIACILRRVGHKDAGMLSNTAGGGDAGELSLTGEDDDEQKTGLQ